MEKFGNEGIGSGMYPVRIRFSPEDLNLVRFGTLASLGHCGAGFQDKTKRDTAADLNIISVHKATPNCKICFFSFLQNFGAETP